MNVIAINGSARKDGNTTILIKTVLNILEKELIDCEIIYLAGEKIQGCQACDQCKKNRNEKCIISDDIINNCIQKMKHADAIILASPTYFCNVTAEMKALIDRAGRVGRANENLFKNKIGAAIVSQQRAGAIHTFNSINLFFLIEQMIIPGSSYWNIGIGGEKGEVMEDTKGLSTMEVLAEQIIWLLKKLHD